MKQFRKNVFRIALKNKASLIGNVFIIAIGIFVLVSMLDTLRNLSDQIEQLYRKTELADVFAEVSGISAAELNSASDIEGIREASGRVAQDVRIYSEDFTDIVTVHLMSYDGEEKVNRVSLKNADGSGEYFTEKDEIYIGARMAQEYGFKEGQKLKAVINGNAVDFVYRGSCNAPDYIYAIPPGGAMVPDGKAYDIACISKGYMQSLTGKKDSFNELGFLLESGYTYEDVRCQLIAFLEKDGLESICSREKQSSYEMVSGEMEELISMGTIFPLLFMLISVFMMYVVQKKMIEKDRTLIGAMKAFGLKDSELIGAYLAEGLIAGLFGAALGSLFASSLGRFMFDMYVDFFNLPDPVYHDYLKTRLIGLALAAVTGVLAAYLGVKGILDIDPAQAMRAKTPENVRENAVIGSLSRRLGSSFSRLALRAIVRNPFRGLLIVIAIAFPFSLLPSLLSFSGVADRMFMDQFEKIQTYDLQVSLDHYADPVTVSRSGEILDYVEKAEAIGTFSAEFTKGSRSEFAVIYALPENAELWNVYDSRGNACGLPENGIILNSRIAEKLNAFAGDRIYIQSAGVTSVKTPVTVEAVIEETFGSGCYMKLESMPKLFNSMPAANDLLLKVSDGKLQAVKDQLLGAGRISWLVDAGRILQSYKDMMGEMIGMIDMFAVLAVAAGIVLIYNISMISIRERMTEFGTLKILGCTEKEIGGMLLFEQLIYYAGGLLLGIPGGKGVIYLIENLMLSDSYTVHMDIEPAAYAASVVICFGITAAAWYAETRYLRKIELTEILKERE